MLYSTEGYNKINNWPLNFLRTGNYYHANGFVSGHKISGQWWSAISNSDIRAHNLDITLTYLYPSNSNRRGFGFAIRCVVREG